jgi:hypothetical protein
MVLLNPVRDQRGLREVRGVDNEARAGGRQLRSG